MFATVRMYRANPAQMDELLHILDAEFLPRIRERPGLCAYQAIDGGDGTLATVSCFTSREEAEASTELASAFIAERLEDFDIERTGLMSGEIKVSVAEQQVLEPAHV
jgi:hypothetical protein